MTFGGAVGLISARRGRFLKKLSYTTIGIGGKVHYNLELLYLL